MRRRSTSDALARISGRGEWRARTVMTCVAIALATLLAACSSTSRRDDDAHDVGGDLPEMRARGMLRILYQPTVTTDSALPRHGTPGDFELELARRFARAEGLDPVLIPVATPDRMIPELLAGRGDVAAADILVTKPRKRRVAFTVPTDIVREQVVVRASDQGVHDAADLAGRRVALHAQSPHHGTLRHLLDRQPGIEVDRVPDELDTVEVLHRVAQGAFDVTIADSRTVEACLGYRDDLRVAFDVTEDRPIAWAVRPESRELLKRLNLFLTEARLTDRGASVSTDDLQAIRQRRVVRVLTRNAAASYFLWKGRLMGFEYDLARRFARQHQLRLEVVVPPPGEDLLEWLRHGRGDFVAASLTPSEERRAGGIAFSRPYNRVSHVVVARNDDADLDDVGDLIGRTFWVRRSSSYWSALEALRANGVDLKLMAAPEGLSTEEIIGRVADGRYDLTLADSHVVAIELGWRDNLRAALSIGDDVPLAWAVRASNPELLSAIDDYLGKIYRSEFYNIKHRQYFENTQRIRSHVAYRTRNSGGLSPFDGTVRRYAELYGFDWRMIVAQMYQESRFDPRARSFAGARGLMQLLPRTARELGFEGDLYDPEIAIQAGIAYMDWVRDRFDPELPVTDRMWFTLAAYNAGPGHVRDARRLALEQGLNPNRWFDNVEEAMLLLSRRQYFEASQHGYCRCGQTVHYVREVRDRYRAYVDSTTRLAAAF